MKLRTLLGHIDEAESAGDIEGTSGVFAVVRNEKAALNAADAWYAISIVDLEVDAEDDAVTLIADGSEDATDVSMTEFRARVTSLPVDRLNHDVLVRILEQAEGGRRVREDVPVVEAYADENGLGLMTWFEGYERWQASQG